MRSPRAKILLAAGLSSLLVAIPAFSQDTPESLLPPGFQQPEETPPPEPQVQEAPTPEGPAPVPGAEAPPRFDAPRGPSNVLRPGETEVTDAAQEDLEQLVLGPPPNPFAVPQIRQVQVVGFLEPDNWGLPPDAFGRANGAFLGSLMRRLDAPLPSRWASILLRRTLLSRLPAPPMINPVDWVAERAWLLVRMGEADAARALVQSVDPEIYTPKMIQVAVQTALATADPGGLCPLVGPGREISSEPVWPLSEAMCAALEGEASRASALIDQARRRSGASGIDLLLAEKVVGAGTNTRRAVQIQWDEVDQINAWRFGLAAATGLEIPERLMETAGPQVQAWRARAPMLPLEQRLDAAGVAAALGVFSSSNLVDIHSLLLDGADPGEGGDTTGGRLRRAFVHRDQSERLEAMRDLWNDGEAGGGRYAQLILTAGPASGITPSEERARDAGDLIAAMLSAGMDQEAARWAPFVAAEGAGQRAWALLAVGAPAPVVDLGAGRIRAFHDEDDSEGDQRSKMLLAALAGLGRIDLETASGLAEEMGVPLGRQSRWSRALDHAAQRGQSGTVVLLAAVGMQTGQWTGVPAAHLFHIVRALRQVGLEYQARMIAAEALTRL